jgi:hypothetical protein
LKVLVQRAKRVRERGEGRRKREEEGGEGRGRGKEGRGRGKRERGCKRKERKNNQAKRHPLSSLCLILTKFLPTLCRLFYVIRKEGSKRGGGDEGRIGRGMRRKERKNKASKHRLSSRGTALSLQTPVPTSLALFHLVHKEGNKIGGGGGDEGEDRKGNKEEGEEKTNLAKRRLCLPHGTASSLQILVPRSLPFASSCTQGREQDRRGRGGGGDEGEDRKGREEEGEKKQTKQNGVSVFPMGLPYPYKFLYQGLCRLFHVIHGYPYRLMQR